jgi:hypothetical protein
MEDHDQGRASRVKRRIPYDGSIAGRSAEYKEPGKYQARELEGPGRLRYQLFGLVVFLVVKMAQNITVGTHSFPPAPVSLSVVVAAISAGGVTFAVCT